MSDRFKSYLWYLEVLCDIEDARQPALVMMFSTHVPLSHGMHHEGADRGRLALHNTQFNSQTQLQL